MRGGSEKAHFHFQSYLRIKKNLNVRLILTFEHVKLLKKYSIDFVVSCVSSQVTFNYVIIGRLSYLHPSMGMICVISATIILLRSLTVLRTQSFNNRLRVNEQESYTYGNSTQTT
jgi:hypothetical protein